MKRNSVRIETMLDVIKRGYYIDKEGNVFNNKNIEVIGFVEDSGYKTFGVRTKDRPCVKVPFHQLQAYQKFGDKVFKTDCVRHLDGNPLNNSYNNIEIGSQSDNMMDKTKEDRQRCANYATSFIRKYNKDEVRKYYKENGRSYKKTMNKFNISSKGTLHYVLNS